MLLCVQLVLLLYCCLIFFYFLFFIDSNNITLLHRPMDISSPEYLEQLASSGNKLCYLDISVNEAVPTRVVIELYYQINPKTCDNFAQICAGSTEGVTYAGTDFTRYVKDGWIEGGKLNGDAVIEPFPDESFAVEFDSPGIVAMTNSGAHTNASKFFITLSSTTWMNTKSVAFGKVVQGMEAFGSVTSDKTEKPGQSVIVKACGVL